MEETQSKNDPGAHTVQPATHRRLEAKIESLDKDFAFLEVVRGGERGNLLSQSFARNDPVNRALRKHIRKVLESHIELMSLREANIVNEALGKRKAFIENIKM